MTAKISPCRKYRYSLQRDLVDHPAFQPSDDLTDKRVLFIGVNPSTADGDSDDATIRKMMGFAARWSCTRMTVGNLFAYRSTDVRNLGRHYNNPFASTDDLWNQQQREILELNKLIERADLIIPCWGRASKLPPLLRDRVDEVRWTLRNSGKKLQCLGLTKTRDPKHPLMLGYDTPLEDF